MTQILTQIPAAVGGFFGWWGGELAALIPQRLARLFRGAGGRLVVELTSDEASVLFLSDGGADLLGRIDTAAHTGAQRKTFNALTRGLRRGNVVTTLRLPPDQVLRKTLRLPAQAAENLREVLGFEMDRQTPFHADDVYFDHRIVGRDDESRQIEVEIIVAPRDAVHQALEIAASLGVVPDRVDVEGIDDGGYSPINLMPPALEPARRGAVERLAFLLTVVALGLSAVAVALPLAQRQQGLETIDAHLRTAKAEAKAATVLRQRIDRMVADSRFLSDKRRASPTAIRALGEITRLLPDDSWVGTLRITSDSVQITGFSAAASSLIGILQSSPLFESVKFRSPVTQDARLGVERFSISATLRTPQEKAGESPKDSPKESGQ